MSISVVGNCISVQGAIVATFLLEKYDTSVTKLQAFFFIYVVHVGDELNLYAGSVFNQ